MERKIISSLTIPKCEGRAFEVKKGHILRVIETEGKQVGDLTALNLHDFKEVLSPEQTIWANRSLYKAEKLYSKPPRENVMFTIIDDKVGVHWVHGSRCSKLTYKSLFNVEGHRSCQDNLAEALKPYGISADDVPGNFNVFMKVEVDENGKPTIMVPPAQKGDYIDMRAEMDLLVAISACPSELAPTNDYNPKSLGVEIYEES